MAEALLPASPLVVIVVVVVVVHHQLEAELGLILVAFSQSPLFNF
jgi:hypothetical protein